MKRAQRQILKNQLAMMELLKALDWKLTMETTISPESDTWEHSINGPMKETKELLERTPVDVGTHD